MKNSAAPTKEDLLRAAPGFESNGYHSSRILASDFRIEGHTTIDALTLDPVGRLVLLFFGPKDDGAWIFAVLDAVSWIERNRPLLRERFSLAPRALEIPPQIVLIASEFAAKTLARLDALRGIDLVLLESGWIALAGERRLSMRPVPRRHGETEARSDFPGWALDPKGAGFLREAVEKIAKIDPEIAADWGPGRLDFLYRGKLLALLLPRAEGLRVLIPEEGNGGEPSDRVVEDRAQLVQRLDAIFRRYVEFNLPELEAGGAEPESRGARPLPAAKTTAGEDELLSAEEVEAISK